MADDEIDVRLRKVRATLGARQPVSPQSSPRSEDSRPTVPALVLQQPESSSVTAVLRLADLGAPDPPQNTDEELALRVYESLGGDPLRIRAFRRYLRKLTGQSG
ncbi:MAG: hypothetical protein JWM74_5537 [Myxococcaceae bacterium]|nr:hypothetical protein [Myxococcaceae bacterium]